MQYFMGLPGFSTEALETKQQGLTRQGDFEGAYKAATRVWEIQKENGEKIDPEDYNDRIEVALLGEAFRNSDGGFFSDSPSHEDHKTYRDDNIESLGATMSGNDLPENERYPHASRGAFFVQKVRAC